MLITRLGGIQSDADVLQEPDKVEAIFEADGTINVGTPVMHDTGFTDGRGIVEATAAADHRACGIYEGRGGTGAETSTSGLTGNDAADGDVVYVTVYGHAKALCDGGTTNISWFEALNVAANKLDGEATVEAGEIAAFLSLNTCNTDDTVTDVFVKCM